MKKLTKEQEVKVGKWYNLDFGKCLLFVTELISHKEAIGYGFDYTGAWREDGTRWGIEGAIEATPEEVKSALIAEAKRRYKVGDILRLENIKSNCFIFSERLHYIGNGVVDGMVNIIFVGGQWASVLAAEKPSLQDDIQALKDRWPDINFTVIAERKK